MRPIKQVVCAAIFGADGRMLLARRAPGQHLEGHWELPGGKVEPGESLESALQRELFEELGLVVSVGKELARTVHHYDRGSIELIALAVAASGAVAHLTAHDVTEWFAAEETANILLAPADIPLLERIREAHRSAIRLPRPTSA